MLKQLWAAEKTESLGTGKKDKAGIETSKGETAAKTGKDEAGSVKWSCSLSPHTLSPTRSRPPLAGPADSCSTSCLILILDVLRAGDDAIPPGAQWTNISSKLVNPEVQTIGKERRFEVREDFVICRGC